MPEPAQPFDAIRLDARDTVATMLRAGRAGSQPHVSGHEGEAPRLGSDLPRGHKFALVPIRAGETVFKYGAPIGVATAEIEAGDHVHLHNLEGFAGRAARRERGQ